MNHSNISTYFTVFNPLWLIFHMTKSEMYERKKNHTSILIKTLLNYETEKFFKLISHDTDTKLKIAPNFER